MALLWVDGFEKYGASGNTVDRESFKGKYSTYTDSISIITHGSGKAVDVSGFSHFSTPALTTNQTIIVGFAYKASAFYDDDRIVQFRTPNNDGDNVHGKIFGLAIDKDGATTEIKVERGTTELAVSSALDLQTDTWYYIEVKVYGHNSSGTCNVKVDGSEVINFSGDTKYSSDYDYTHVDFNRQGVSGSFSIDDLYICDGSGSSHNDFQGTCNVLTLSPSSDASGNWTPSTGNDMYAVVDDDVLGSDYIGDGTTGNQAIVELDDLSSSATILGVSITVESQVSGNLSKYSKVLTQNGTNNIIESANAPPGLDDIVSYTHMMETDPDGNTWQPSTINSLRIGVEVS